MKPPLIILDRDGVINEDSPNYIKSVDEWIPIPQSLAAISLLKSANIKVAIATNQSGIGRGLFSENTLKAQHQKMQQGLQKLDCEVDYIAYCPHTPDDNCTCRKPKPGLLIQISKKFNIPLDNIPVIGDSLRDLEAATAVNAFPILVRTGKGQQTLTKDLSSINPPIYDNLHAAVQAILNQP